MKNFKYDNFDESSPVFDDGPDEPELCKLLSFEDCNECYFRKYTFHRITEKVKQLYGGRV
jgi:hypothetical protein